MMFHTSHLLVSNWEILFASYNYGSRPLFDYNMGIYLENEIFIRRRRKKKRWKDAFTNSITVTRIVAGLLLKLTLSNFTSRNLRTHYFQLHSRPRFHAIKLKKNSFTHQVGNLHLGLFFICYHTATRSPHSPSKETIKLYCKHLYTSINYLQLYTLALSNL